MNFAVLLLTRLSGAWKKKKRKKQKKTVSSVERELRWTDPLIVTEIEVRDHIVPTDVMLGPVAVRSRMRTKQIDAKPLQTERRIIARAAPRIRYSLLADVAIVVIGTAREIETLIVLTAADARIRWATMIAKDGTERMSVRSFIVGEVIPGVALMNCLTVTKDPVEADDEELTVMAKVLAAHG
jgi:hypothetical protein